MKFPLDTNAIMKGLPSVIQRLQSHAPRDFGLSTIVNYELLYGAYKSQRVAANLARIKALQFESLAFDAEDSEHAGQIRALLAAGGTPIGPYDVLIAGQARARDLILVTHNVREFERIPDLQYQDWQH